MHSFWRNPALVLGLLVALAGPEAVLANETSLSGLMQAATFGTPEILESLLASGTELNQANDRGKTALHLAAEFNPNPAVVALLLERGAKIGARDLEGRTPLMLAALHNTGPVIEALLRAGANPQDRDLKGRTAYLYATGATGSFNRKLVGATVVNRLYEAQYRSDRP